MTVYHAYYEDVAKLEAEARKAGWTGEDDGSLLDYAEADRCTGRDFKSKAAAVRWLKDEIDAMRTVFGCGSISEIEEVDRLHRCTYCTCQGRKRVRNLTVTDTGIESEEAVDDCNYDD